MENEPQDDELFALADITEANEVVRAKTSSLSSQLSQDIEACDLKLSLLIAALSSYKKDFALRPFPPDFLAHGEKNFRELERVSQRVPPLPTLSHRLETAEDFLDGVSGLLSWLLHPSHSFNIRTVNLSDRWMEVSSLAGSLCPTPRPTHLFEVHWSKESEKKWQCLKEQGSGRSFYAFHGSALHNFHSILHCGLRQNLNKVSLFGEGTYLHSELLVSLLYSPSGKSWDNSILGSQLSAVALCEIIDHPSVRSHESEGRGSSRGLGNSVPEKYFIVRNDELVRVKYILVYASLQRRDSAGSVALRWCRGHCMTLVIVLYLLLLLAVGFYNSRSFQHWMRRLNGDL